MGEPQAKYVDFAAEKRGPPQVQAAMKQEILRRDDQVLKVKFAEQGYQAGIL
jgi:hypothetical protein